MKKSIKPQNQTLEAVVTADAKRQAEALRIPLSSYISHLAAKADELPVTIRVPMADIQRINMIVRDGRIAEWVEEIVADALKGDGRDSSGSRITLDLPAKTAAKLRKAAEFEEMSVVDYVKDGIRRDLDLTNELMATEGGAR